MRPVVMQIEQKGTRLTKESLHLAADTPETPHRVGSPPGIRAPAIPPEGRGQTALRGHASAIVQSGKASILQGHTREQG